VIIIPPRHLIPDPPPRLRAEYCRPRRLRTIPTMLRQLIRRRRHHRSLRISIHILSRSRRSTHSRENTPLLLRRLRACALVRVVPHIPIHHFRTRPTQRRIHRRQSLCLPPLLLLLLLLPLWEVEDIHIISLLLLLLLLLLIPTAAATTLPKSP